MVRAAGQDAGFCAAMCQIDVHTLAGMQSGGICYQLSVGITNNGKASGQGCIGVQMGECPRNIVQCGQALLMLFTDCGSKPLSQQSDAPTMLFGPRHGPSEAKGRAIQSLPMTAQVSGKGSVKLRCQQRQSIVRLYQSRRRMDQAQGEMIHPLLVAGDTILGGPDQCRSKIGNFAGRFVPSLSGNLGSSSWRRRTQVGDKVVRWTRREDKLYLRLVEHSVRAATGGAIKAAVEALKATL